MHLFRDLAQREAQREPIKVAVIGAGFFGSGVIRQLARAAGVTPAVVANRTPDHAIDALLRSGVDRHAIRLCHDAASARDAMRAGAFVVTGDLDVPCELEEIDVVAETTGNLHVGARAALRSIDAGKHFVAANPEVQATIGAILRIRADRAGVVYSDMDGDQPGIIQRTYDYVRGIGFTPVVAGNCKGVMKRYATPETQAAYCRENHIKPWIATAAADGTKLNIEMCLVANANGLVPAATGMTGVHTTLETLLEDFEKAALLGSTAIVEYTLGIPVGTFVIGYSNDSWIAEEMRYFKMGNGPYYLFYEPRVICQYDAVPSIAEAALYRHPVISPLPQRPATEVAAYAKKDLLKGTRLDGIGGFDCYGQVVSTRQFVEEGLLPIGIAEYARLKHGVSKDAPLRVADVDLEHADVVTRLREEQEAMWPDPAPLARAATLR